MEERLTLSTKELKRVRVLELVEAGHLTVSAAAKLLPVSERQCWRLLARYRSQGAAGLMHGNRGRPAPHRLSLSIRAEVLALAEGLCRDYNDQHLTDVLREERGVRVSRASVRRIRRAAGLASPHRHRRRRGHQRRERRPQAGLLLQLDASFHAWLEERGPQLALVAAIDDATNEVVGALFRPQEDAAGYCLLMQGVSQRHGLPVAVYADRHTIFQSPAKPTLDQQLLGQVPQSHFARLLAQLGIQLIPAHSPQAKGRIERLWQTLQDRLVKELRQAGAADLNQANQLLATYLPKFNQQFRHPAAQPDSAFRPLPPGCDLALAFAFQYQRQVANDHSISFFGHKLALPPLVHGRSYARAKVQLFHNMTGQLIVYYQDWHLATFEPDEPGPPRVDHFCPQTLSTSLTSQPTAPLRPSIPTPSRPAHKPAANHPWRNYPAALPDRRPVPPTPSIQAGDCPDTFSDQLG
jgi:transposase